MKPTPHNGSTREPNERLVNQYLVRTGTVAVGTFRAHPSHPDFRYAGRITEAPSIVFPRTSVWIQQEGRGRFVADANIVVYYNLEQPYVRDRLSDQGDHCDWFHFASEVLAEAVRGYDRGVEARLEQPFSFAYGPTDSRSFLLERLVFQHICETERPDLLYVEEVMLLVLRRIIDNVYRGRGREPSGNARVDRQRAAELTQHAKAVLAERFRDSLSLTEIAEEIGFSVFHLCRLFRQYCGTTLHKYRNQLRVRMALDLLGEFRQDLTGLALHLGYSSHSHFTSSFRQAFGCTPSYARNIRTSRLMQQFESRRRAWRFVS